jgi:hypothetical protein
MRNPQDFRIHCSQIGKIMSNAKNKGELSQTCKTFLHEWYTGEQEPIHSKYIDKGNWVEDDLIDFMAIQLGFGLAEKCKQSRSDEYIVGSCDVELPDTIVDVKASWNIKTLHSAITDGINPDYEWQGRGYMHLYGKSKFILFHGLMDTPAEINYDNEVSYSHIPDNERWVAYQVLHDQEKVDAIIERVKQCRIYLEGYDAIMKSKLGRVLL